jgi:hypothetical protein
MSRPIHVAFAFTIAVAVCASRSEAQHADHGAHSDRTASRTPTAAVAPGGQAVFATIAEVVRQLDADSTTDWSRVDLGALRRHLIDMDDVTLGSTVRQRELPDGVVLDVAGAGRVREAARRMVTAHARVLDADPAFTATAVDIPGGVRLTVRAERPAARAVARLRALGLVGLLALGDHHAEHHVMLARGGRHESR